MGLPKLLLLVLLLLPTAITGKGYVSSKSPDSPGYAAAARRFSFLTVSATADERERAALFHKEKGPVRPTVGEGWVMAMGSV